MNENEQDRVTGWYPKGTENAVDISTWYSEPDQRWSVPAEEPVSEEEKKKRRRRRTAMLWVFIALLVCAVVLSVLRVISRASIQIVTNTDNGSASIIIPGGSDDGDYEDFRDYFANYYTGSDSVSIPRTTAEAGVTLTLQPASGEELSLQEIYVRVSPAVVGIVSMRDGIEYGWGTGVVFRSDGYIITNTHIISGCDGARVTFTDGRVFEAKLIGEDSESDIAVLKIDAEGLACAEFGDSGTIQVGDEAIAIGNPLGEEYAGTMTNGIISAISRNVQNNGHTMTLLQTNAALNEGNSGGPLVNIYGQVIGITNMKIMGVYTSTVEGIGFAIPSAVVKQIADELLASGQISGRPTIGITAGAVSSEAMTLYDLPAGVYVSSVEEVSDAHAKGMQVGDIILEVNGEKVRSVSEVNAIKDQFGVGDTLTMLIYREGETFEMEVELIDSALVK
ncbi:MAG: S1C family serine protease [Oscillospiraceae bacterium]